MGAICMSVVIQHPAYLLVGVLTGAIYYLLLNGKKGWKTVLAMIPLFVFLAAINPLFNTLGTTRLFDLFGRPYTLEALCYGCALAGMFVTVLLWFGCYNKVLTGDKFTALFGNLIPSASLLLVMVLRLIPNLIRKTKQIAGARKSIGKGADKAPSIKEKVNDSMAVLGALTLWSLEGSIVTGDSMRARGYGTAKRTGFTIYRMKLSDWLWLALMTGLVSLIVAAAAMGQTGARFVPDMELSTTTWGLAAYAGYLLIPSVLHIKEAIRWHISRSKI